MCPFAFQEVIISSILTMDMVLSPQNARRRFLQRFLRLVGGVSFFPTLVASLPTSSSIMANTHDTILDTMNNMVGVDAGAEILASDGLGVLAAAKNMFYGAATAAERLRVDAAYNSAITRECNIIVPEYEMKWDKLRPSPTVFNFTDADYLVNFARQNKILFRGHTLCWHRALPTWFASTVNASNAAQYLTNHIQTVVGRYKGQIHSWDVVNEAIEPTDKKPNNLRNSSWYKFLGENYLELAFNTAAQADPKAMLVYNDYGVEYNDPARRDGILTLLQRLKAKNVPIHALGIQGHLTYKDFATVDTSGFRTFLRDVASLGLKIFITEFDCDDTTLPTDNQQRDTGVAKVYGDYAAIVFNELAVQGFITWGLTDKYSSINSTAPRSDGQQQRPLPLDAALERKMAWYSLEFWFKQTAKRPATTLVEQAQETIAFLECFPNPATDRVNIRFRCEQAMELRIGIVDLQGREIVHIASGAFERGEHTLAWELADGDAASGMYVCTLVGTLNGASVQRSQHILVTR